MRGFEDTYVDIVDYVDPRHPPHLGGPGRRLHLRHLPRRLPRLRRRRPEVRRRARGRGHDAADQRLPRHRATTPTRSSGPATRTRASPPRTARSTSATTPAPGAGASRRGSKVNIWVIANCVSEENEIFEEWVLYNDVARLHQLRHRRARGRARVRQLGREPAARRARAHRDRAPRGRPQAGALPGADAARASTSTTSSARCSTTPTTAATSAPSTVPTHPTCAGTAASQPRGLRPRRRAQDGARPDGDVPRPRPARRRGLLDGQRGRGLQRRRCAGRRSARTAGRALYGEPTGRRVHLWGLHQLYVQDGRIVEDWMLFNEFDVLAQLLRD